MQLFTPCFLISCRCFLHLTRCKAHCTSSFSLIKVRCFCVAVTHFVLYIHLLAGFFADDIHCSPFASRCLLYASPFFLLKTCYSFLHLFCSQPIYCSVLASRSFVLLSRCLPFAAHRSMAQCFLQPLAFIRSLLKVNRSLFWVVDSAQAIYVFFRSIQFSSDKNTAVELSKTEYHKTFNFSTKKSNVQPLKMISTSRGPIKIYARSKFRLKFDFGLSMKTQPWRKEKVNTKSDISRLKIKKV